MYLPSHFEETRVDVIHALIAAYPLATLVVQAADGLAADHIPMLVHAQSASGGSREPSFGVLHGHVARANPLWRAAGDGIDALAIFQGPDSYITPSHYPSKRLTAKVVPTWNYAVVHAHGRLRAIDDPVWLRGFLESLTDSQEQRFAVPWAMADAPDEFITTQLRAIVGIELVVTRLVGKWKMSQNRTPTDRAGVIAGLQAENTDQARAVAQRIRTDPKV